MTRIKLPRFVNGFTDRHGKARYYFRRPGHKAVAVPGLPYTTEFMDAYKLALAGITAPRTTIGSDRLQSGSVAKVVAGYLASAAFNALAPETKRTRRNILERFREQHGEKQVKLLRREHIVAMIEAKAATPSASRNLLNTLRVLIQYSIMIGIRTDDPTLGVKHAKIKSHGYRTWSEDDIARFRSRSPAGITGTPRPGPPALYRTAPRRCDPDGLAAYLRRNVERGATEDRHQIDFAIAS